MLVHSFFSLVLATSLSAFASCPTPDVDAESLNEPAVVRLNESTGLAEVSYDEENSWTPLYAVTPEQVASWEESANLHLAQYYHYRPRVPPGCPPPVVSCPAFVIPRAPFVYIAPPRPLPPPVDIYSRPRRLPPPVNLYSRPRVRPYVVKPHSQRRAAPFVYYRYGRRW